MTTPTPIEAARLTLDTAYESAAHRVIDVDAYLAARHAYAAAVRAATLDEVRQKVEGMRKPHNPNYCASLFPAEPGHPFCDCGATDVGIEDVLAALSGETL